MIASTFRAFLMTPGRASSSSGVAREPADVEPLEAPAVLRPVLPDGGPVEPGLEQAQAEHLEVLPVRGGSPARPALALLLLRQDAVPRRAVRARAARAL